MNKKLVVNIDIGAVVKQLMHHEGLRNKPYKCTAGKLTIGYGRNLDDEGISAIEATSLLMNDIQKALEAAYTIFPGFEHFEDGRQVAIIDMLFNLGVSRFTKFKNMIAAIHRRDWTAAATEAIDSKWYNQVGDRAKTVVKQLQTGEVL